MRTCRRVGAAKPAVHKKANLFNLLYSGEVLVIAYDPHLETCMTRPIAAGAALALALATLPVGAQNPGSRGSERIARLEGVWRLSQTPDAASSGARPSPTVIEIMRTRGRFEVRERTGWGAWQEHVVRPASIVQEGPDRVTVRFLRIAGRQVERVDLSLDLGAAAGGERASLHRGRYARAVLAGRETTVATVEQVDRYFQPLKKVDDTGTVEIERVGTGIWFAAPPPI